MAKKQEEKNKNKITLGSIFGWFFGLGFLISAMGIIAQGNYTLGLLIAVGSLLLIPASGKLFMEKFNFEISKGVKWLIFIVIFILFMVAISQQPSNVYQEDLKEGPQPHLTNSDSKDSASTAESQDSRSFINQGYMDLYASLGTESRKTELQKETLFETYKGKYVRWDGEVVDVDTTLGSTSLQVRHHRPRDPFEIAPDYDVVIYMPRDQIPALSKIGKGDVVSYSGRLSSFSEAFGLTLYLQDGEIVNNK